MIIKDKQIFRVEIKNRIEKYVQEFPVYFYGNIFFNVILLLIILAVSIAIILVIIASSLYEIIEVIKSTYVLFLILVTVSAIFRITLKGFLKNIKILHRIQAFDYDFGVEDHEMDNAIEFIEDLPKDKDDVERMRVALSFNKIIDVLSTVKLIVFEKKLCILERKFKYDMENVLEEYEQDLYKLKNNK